MNIIRKGIKYMARHVIANWYLRSDGLALSSSRSDVSSSKDDSGQVPVECIRYGTVTVRIHRHLLIINIHHHIHGIKSKDR